MKRFYTALLPLMILTVWYFANVLQIIHPLFLPSPEIVFVTLGELLFTGEILPDAAATLARLGIGFGLAIIIGVPTGLFMGYYKKVYYSLEFVVDFFRSIPATALFPLFLLFFGIGNEAKVAVVVFAASLIIIVNTMYGVRNGKKLRLLAARTMRTNKADLFRKVILPEALPDIFTGLRIAISLSLIIVIVTEMFIGTTVGLGHVIIDSQLVYKIPDMYAAIILAGIIGFLINVGIRRVEERIVHWRGM